MSFAQPEKAMPRTYAIISILSAVAGTAMFCGCGEQTRPGSEPLLAASKSAFDKEDYSKVVEKTTEFLVDNERSALADEAHYYRGRARYRLGDLAGAAADMDKAIAATRDKGLRSSAAIVHGDVAFARGDWAAAEKWYRHALSGLDEAHKPADYAKLQLGCAMQRLGQWEAADAQFDRVIFLFPGSPEAVAAADNIRATAWTVVAGLYDQRPAAQIAADALAAKALSATVSPRLRQGRLAFAVQVGTFPRHDDAAAMLQKVRAISPDACVMETK